MNALIGLIIIAIGSAGQSSSYVPIKKIKSWSWESFWIVQGIFAWLIFPLLGALLAIPCISNLIALFTSNPDIALQTMGYGFLWGVGGLTFGLGMRYLGVAMGQSIGMGMCSVFGTLMPALLKGTDLLTGDGLKLLIGVTIALAGIVVIGIAGGLREKESKNKNKNSEFALGKGLLVALLAGAMSGCFSLGLEAGESLKATIAASGAQPIFVGNPVTLLVTVGGLITNILYCLWQNGKNKTFSDYTSINRKTWSNNLLFCSLAGVLWYSQFFGLEMGRSFIEPDSLMMKFSWSILMSLNVIFSNIWGILLKEWKGCSTRTIATLIGGLLLLIASLIYPSL